MWTIRLCNDNWSDNEISLVIDLRGLPSPVCPCCGSTLLRLTVEFDPQTYEIAGYLLNDAKCVECHCLITAPTPLDHPDYI